MISGLTISLYYAGLALHEMDFPFKRFKGEKIQEKPLEKGTLLPLWDHIQDLFKSFKINDLNPVLVLTVLLVSFIHSVYEVIMNFFKMLVYLYNSFIDGIVAVFFFLKTGLYYIFVHFFVHPFIYLINVAQNGINNIGSFCNWSFSGLFSAIKSFGSFIKNITLSVFSRLKTGFVLCLEYLNKAAFLVQSLPNPFNKHCKTFGVILLWFG